MEIILNFIIFFGSTFFGGVLGYLFKTQIDHRLAIVRIHEGIRITEFNKASAKIRAAFAPALAFIYLAKETGPIHEPLDVDKFLRDAILCHASAIEMFRIFIPENKSAAYQKAWEKYHYEVRRYGFEATSFNQEIDNPWKVFEDPIHDILRFADNES